MSSAVDFPSRICKHERCELDGVHLSHKITPLHVHCEICDIKAGELCIASFERVEDGVSIKPRMCGPFHHGRIQTVRGLDEKPSKSFRDPWVLPAPEALDESILRACSDCMPRVLTQLASIVENDYGSLGNEESGFRRLQRRLKKLCEAGALLQIDLGKRLFAYVSPRARSLDVDSIRDVIMDNSWYSESSWHSA